MRRFVLGLLLAAAPMSPAMARIPDKAGPFNAAFLQGGVGIEREIGGAGALVQAGAPYTVSTWVRTDSIQSGRVLLIALGNVAAQYRALALDDGKLELADGSHRFTDTKALAPNRWTHVTAVYDGSTLRLYVDGQLRGKPMAMERSTAVAPRISIAPAVAGAPHFGGSLVYAAVDDAAWSSEEVRAAAVKVPNFDLVQMWRVGIGWEWQKHANTGLWRQQDPWTLPQARGPGTTPRAIPVKPVPVLQPIEPGRWQVNGWRLAGAPDIRQDGAVVSRPDYDASGWRVATVPGTVLTTLVDRGVYPDPYYGLNNMAIPERLARQDWWYRTSFDVPSEAAGRTLTLVFNGINYASEIWVNGAKLGNTTGAFIRGRFDVVPVAGPNVIAVRVSPPPHPGIPHEQSIKGGVGENGGQLAIDGPTFVATEGWDWIPGIRDRNTGIWLPVELEAHGPIRLLDPHIVTDLPLPRIDSADVHVSVPVENIGPSSVQITVQASFDTYRLEKVVTVAPGVTTISFDPVTVRNPRLWWPNGYGEQALHDMRFTVVVGGQPSDAKTVRFGIREISYDLSLFDSKGALRRVNVQTTDGGLKGEKLIAVGHEAIKQSPRGWAESLTPAGERSPAVSPIDEAIPEPHLAIRVNGVRIAARGGSWGMDDAMKRIDRDRLEPYFRLEKEAHMNVVRNWMGNNTEPQFYDLADEYGLMVLNDFWQSTQNFQVEPQDPQLFLANARDTIARYRNHPSIVLWFGRNEGVPYPMLNEGLDDAVSQLDGTRWYTGSSNEVNLQGSGPYNYRPPVGYFTDLATGFSVETGTPSLSTLESIRSYVPQADRWPLSDTLAYHDWHFAGNGDTKTFMQTLGTMFGPATSLEDFERKAQMMNLETHKAMYEGFLGHLWTKNTGRLLWMTHPSWPSNAWQIYSWDYDTHAAYYGAKKATEPLHVQLNLPGNELVVLNTTREDRKGLHAITRVVSLDNRVLFTRDDAVDALANRATPLAPVPLDTLFDGNGVVLVSLKLLDGAGAPVSENFYWRGRDAAAYRALNDLQKVLLDATVESGVMDGKDKMVGVVLSNPGKVAVLNVKLTLQNAAGERILPAFYSDNYVALLPGERRRIEVRYPATITGAPSFTVRGWNVDPATVR
ncbi:MAG: LamG-like jellyroll fold domain-containing protein [Sphingomonas bacterium]